MLALLLPSGTHFENEEDRAEAVHEITDMYLTCMACGDDDPAESTLQYLLDSYEYDTEPTVADIERFIEPHREELARRLPLKKMEVKRVLDQDRFFELRGEGRTVASIARTLGADKDYLAHSAAQADFLDAKRERVRTAQAIRREEAQAKAYRARMRLLSKLTGKVETALETRDFSDVPTDKLAEMLLRLAQLTKEETPPPLSVSVRGTRI